MTAFFVAVLALSGPELPSVAPPAVQAVDVEERLGRVVPADLAFTDSSGRPVRMRDLVSDGKPVLLALAYYRCPMLCGLTLRGLARGLSGLGWKLGEDYRVVTVSFDPRDTPDTAARTQAGVLAEIGRPDARDAWPFLVADEATIRALTDAVGFRYALDERTGEYAHPAVVVALAPGGKIVRYLYGVEFFPRDLRLAMVESGEGRAGSFFDRVLMTCYRYDPLTRRYGPYIFGFLRIGAVVIFVVAASFVAWMWRLERRRRNA